MKLALAVTCAAGLSLAGALQLHSQNTRFPVAKASFACFGEPEEAEPIGSAALRHRVWQRGAANGTELMTALRQRDDLLQAQGADTAAPTWTYLGPDNVGGRIRAIVFSPTNTAVWYIASVGGGIWKTTNSGATWATVNDNFPSMSVGALVIDKNNANTLYAGTGESYFDTTFAENNKAAVQGAGIFKTTDGGLTWTVLPSTQNSDFNCVARISMSPANSNFLLAATNTGIFRTGDAGATWTKVYNGKAYDVDFHPTDATRAVAGIPSLPGVVRSADGGVTWTNSSGIPATLRCETVWSKSVSNNVYAGVANGGFVKVYKSTDNGATWALKSSGTGPSNYEAYNDSIWVDPTNDNNVLVAGVSLYRSTNQGVNISQVFGSIHSDFHGIFEGPSFNGSTNRQVYFATDGGLYRVTDYTTGSTSTFFGGMGITQFYGGAMNDSTGKVIAGAQDNSTQVSNGSVSWTGVIGGDGVFCANDPSFPSTFYAGYYYMNMFRSTDNAVNFSTDVTGGITDRGSEATCNFIPYLTLDPNQSNTMLACCLRLWRSTNIRTGATPTWTSIKPPTTGPPPGDGPPNDHFAPENPLNLSFVAVAKGNSNVIWASHNNGQVWMTANGTASSPTWTRVDTNGPLPARWVSSIVIDNANSNHVYLGLMGWNANNIWETTDGGATFHEVTGTGVRHIPSAPVSALALDALNPGHLLAGTDIGIFATWDNGVTWSVTTQGPGTVPVDFFQWRNNSQLVAYTYGRGVWQGNVSPVTVPVVPSSYSIFRGTYMSGTVADAQASDDLYLRIGRGFVANFNEYPIQVDLKSSAPGTVAQSISVTVELSASHVGLQQRLQAFDYDAAAWVDLDVRLATTADQVVTVPLPGTVARFIDPATKEIKVRVGLKQVGFVPVFGWFLKLDQVSWSIKE